MILGKGSFAVRIPTESIGDTIQLEGAIFGDGHQSIYMMLPGEKTAHIIQTCSPTIEQWQEFIDQTNDPVMPIEKAIVRKSVYKLDQNVVWACYYRDNYTCVYCGTKGVPLTYDHFLAQKFGGKTTIENGRAACRPCNKRKGHMTIDEWKTYCASHGLNDGSVL